MRYNNKSLRHKKNTKLNFFTRNFLKNSGFVYILYVSKSKSNFIFCLKHSHTLSFSCILTEIDDGRRFTPTSPQLCV